MKSKHPEDYSSLKITVNSFLIPILLGPDFWPPWLVALRRKTWVSDEVLDNEVLGDIYIYKVYLKDCSSNTNERIIRGAV